MGTRRPAMFLLRNNPQWQELIPHLKPLKIEVETQEELPLWDDAAAEYVRKLKATLVGRDVPILTVQQELDEAFPAVARWIKALGRIEIGVEEGQGFVVRALAPEGLVFEDRGSRTLGEALIALERGITRSEH